MRYLVDTEVVINALALAPGAGNLQQNLRPDGLAVGIITMGEPDDGTHRSSDPVAAPAAIRGFLDGYTVRNLPDSTVAAFGRVRALPGGKAGSSRTPTASSTPPPWPTISPS